MLPRKKLIENFIVQIDRPFCIREISQVTGVPYSSVSDIVSKLKKQNRINALQGLHNPKFYRYIRNSKEKKKKEPLNFTPDINKLRIIYDKIGTYPRIADVVNVLPYSEATIWRYIRILLHDKCIEKQKSRYKQRVFKPSGRSYSEYPMINKHYKRPRLIKELERICKIGDFKVPYSNNLSNSDLIKISEKYLIKLTILLINR